MGNKYAVIPKTAPLCPICFPNYDGLFHLVYFINSNHQKENSMASCQLDWWLFFHHTCSSKLKSCFFTLNHLENYMIYLKPMTHLVHRKFCKKYNFLENKKYLSCLIGH